MLFDGQVLHRTQPYVGSGVRELVTMAFSPAEPSGDVRRGAERVLHDYWGGFYLPLEDERERKAEWYRVS